MVFVRLRVAHTIESGFDNSLQLSQIFVPCVVSPDFGLETRREIKGGGTGVRLEHDAKVE